MFDQKMLGMKIFLKSETTKMVKETNIISDSCINILAAENDRLVVVGEMKDTNCLCPKGCLQISIESAFILQNRAPLGPFAG